MLDAVLDGVIVVDERACVEWLNTEACRMLETSTEALRGRPIADVLPEAQGLTEQVLSSGHSAVLDDRVLPRRFAPDLVVGVGASPLSDVHRLTNGVVLALRDRTLQRNLAERATEREQLSAYGTIAAGIAHEVKNPLGGIRGAAEIIASRTQQSKLAEAANLIVREVDRIRTLVDELMVFKQGESLSPELLNIHEVLDGVLELLTLDPLATGVKLDRSFDPSIPEIRADPDRLTQVFLNLCRNALQALAGEGTLRIQTRMALDHRLNAADGTSIPTLSVCVIDDGPGIEPAILEQLSTPFFTTRQEGTGLGLAVSRHWVARHSGLLRVESAPGAGTRVRVLLPVAGPSKQEVGR